MASTRRPPGVRGTGAKPAPRQQPTAKGQPAAKGRPVAPGRPAPKNSTASSRNAGQRQTQALAHGAVTPRAVVGAGRRGGSVSLTSAQRFAARARARRRRRTLVGAGVVLLSCTLTWAALGSRWATVQKVEISGTHRVPEGIVRDLADGELGRPMLMVRTADLAERVRRQRLVRSVRVTRHWPGVVRVAVREREPVAALPSGDRIALVDPDGVVVERVRTAPAGLPTLQVKLGERGVPAIQGCLRVLSGLPLSLSRRLVAIGADSPDGIWLTLRRPGSTGSAGTAGSGQRQVRVEWGDAEQTPRKAEVLSARVRRPGAGYDVRSPDKPAIRGT